MELEERESEIILEKLERMEDFLKSFITSLRETEQKLIRRKVPLYAEVTGTIVWGLNSYARVEKGDPLYYIEPTSDLGLRDRRYSPAVGELHIYKVTGEKVKDGWKVGEIWLDAVPV